MRFHLIVNLARTAVAQLPRRRPLALYNHQCRAYIPSGHHHQFTKKARVTETSSQIFTYFSILRRSYSSKSSNSNMGLLSWYLGMLDLRPILTKSISAAIIYGAADITSQQEYYRKRDMVTTFKKLAMGQLVYGPMINGVFFSFNAALQDLENFKGARFFVPPSCFLSLCVMCIQPLRYYSFAKFRESGNEIVARLKRDLIPTLLNGLMYWPLCDFFTYKIIPVHLQPLMNSSFSYLWSIYLTYMASLTKAVPN
ncbi:hypothetical protein DH2020_008059 [Rehmannia glutinosa]|uniref:Uncharacterized protein n=1 Tax=Rehmannia glutinosa TaxID=99300 RepID=A0ABR0TZY0_REHGL